ncbi:hypothetical protein BDN72DRAFT_824429 [Pluteus cervinus]|uniref:Uncharacterized protein n=1 Tax=Pluteus cervinus TaxID=181527 RepID=A0ACD3AJY3_9AGAR|nr:hypothetical protein BDN72DRAFT_824429 [Pluteus cervinus]
MGGEPHQPAGTQKRKSLEMSTSTQNKRIKLTNGHLKSPEFTQHPTFWADDGSVLIQIGDMRMKLHKSRLMANSTWFRSLFDGMSPEENINPDVVQYDDGLALLHLDLMDVRREDFEVLVTAMDNSLDFFLAPQTFSCIAGLVRASSILRFPKLLSYASSILERDFSGRLTPPFSVKEAVEAVELGRRYSYPLILKRGFYELARGAEQFNSHLDSGEHQLKTGSSLLERLGITNLAILLDLRRALVQTWIDITHLPPIECDQPTGKCTASDPTKTWELMYGSGLLKDYQSDPMLGIYKLWEVDWEAKGYCNKCRVERMKWLGEQRNKIWVEDMEKWLSLQVAAVKK